MPETIGARAGACRRRILDRLPMLAFAFAASLTCPHVYAEEDIFRDKFISLGTSSRSGTFHVVGTNLCEAVNQERKASLVRCVPYNTVGSEYNAKAVAYGELSMGITRPDIAYAEFKRKNVSDNHGADLRAVMSLHSTPVMMIVRRAANIADASQIAGHSINLGNRGSSQRLTVELLIKQLGLTQASFSAVTELHTTQMGEAFCQGKIDVIIESLGHPSPFYKKMIEECGGQIVSFSPDFIDKVIAANPLMSRLSIPGGLYSGYPQPVPTFGFRALLVTRSDVSEEAVRRFVASVMNGLEKMKAADPVFQEFDADKMLSPSVAIPQHAGVVNYLNNRKTTASHGTSTAR